MQIELTREESFTVRAGAKAIHGMRHIGEWNGLVELQDAAGLMLILNEGQIVKGSAELLQLLRPVSAGFVPVPGMVFPPSKALPNGLTVPAFYVAQHATTQGADGKISHDPALYPWVNINFYKAMEACNAAGYIGIRESQWLAIAANAAQQDCNWTGGKVGEGDLFQGIRNGGCARSGNYVPANETERRWLMLSNGSKVCDFNGNVFQWVFDDIQGDERGLITKPFDAESPSIALAPYPSEQKGMGYRPSAGRDWSGYALVRGGFWYSDDYAGVFYLYGGRPDYGGVGLGFRCTLPMDSDPRSLVTAKL